MKYGIILLISLFRVLISVAAESKKPLPAGDFIPPFAGEIEIIGTFCELRPNHFHGGLDIRTGGKIGRHVLSVGDGYIARINISTTGYGKALYIAHPNGYTSVYAHLHDFPEKIRWYIEKNQYLLEKFEVELYPEPGLLTVKKGEMVAYSGNTGSSQGPHLHFEIRETATEAPVNPLMCGIRMKDHLAPSFQGLYLYRKDSLEKIHNGHYPSVSLPLYSSHTVKKGKKKKTVRTAISRHTVRYGTYAFGATMRDFAVSMADNNGVNYVSLYRNGTLIYECRMERFLFSQIRMHNNYIDYRRQKQSGAKMHKIFRDDGSLLPFWEHSPGDGWFEISDSSVNEFRLVISDVYGNKSEKRIWISGSPDGQSVKNFIRYERNAAHCKAASDNTVEVSPEFRVFIPSGALYSDYHMPFRKNFGHNYQVGDPLVPLDTRIELRFRLHPTQLHHADKFTVFSGDGRKYGGELKDGNWLCARVRDFGNYYLVLDTVKPSIRPVAVNRNGYFSFTVTDAVSGIGGYDFRINGKWVLLEYEPRSSLVYGRIPTPLPPGNNFIEFKVRDARGNERVYQKTIYIP